jgi:predicted Zn-dependent peptidase
MRTKLIAAAMLGLTLAGCATAPAQEAPLGQERAGAATGLQIEAQYFTLPNGLKVVLAREASAPTVTVGVYYGIGFRIEPRNRTGFAHLFEHLMFQGSQHAPKGTFIGSITNAGGVLNGSTRFDYTNYYQVVPSNALESILWLEADRMARPVINKEVLENQQGVVANEVKVNVLNQPYGGWPWLDMPQLANENWHNAHNFYGALEDLAAATVEDATQFFNSFYRPNNAVLIVVGDIDYAQARLSSNRVRARARQPPSKSRSREGAAAVIRRCCTGLGLLRDPTPLRTAFPDGGAAQRLHGR